MRPDLKSWLPVAVLLGGLGLIATVARPVEMALRAPLEGIPASFGEFRRVKDLEISKDEQAVAGMSNYVMRVFEVDSLRSFSVYVGYYTFQRQGKTIHSPKNCLPGAGWEVLDQSTVPLASSAPTSPVVNRYYLANKGSKALVYYWYQGRGRIEANEFRVKWNLIQDAAATGRTEEALVRVVIPITPTMDEKAADRLAREIAQPLARGVDQLLPTYPGRTAIS
ncbi:MAG: EpsI family protein [Gemmatimonadales bacterium]|nr:EpsI family protein [Gemmatimonadales bacterium]